MIELLMASAITSIVLCRTRSEIPNSITQPVVETFAFPVNAALAQDGWHVDALYRQLEVLEALPEDWDGEGAAQISKNAVKFAQLFSLQLGSLESPAVIPAASGTLILEWESSKGEAVLEIGETKYSLYIRRTGLSPIFKKGGVEALGGEASQVTAMITGALFPLKLNARSIVAPYNLQSSVYERHAA